jgi:hypothetical protein
MQSIWISNDWDPATSPQLSASGYGKVDFEGYINFNDAGAEYKFTSFPEWKNMLPGDCWYYCYVWSKS